MPEVKAGFVKQVWVSDRCDGADLGPGLYLVGGTNLSVVSANSFFIDGAGTSITPFASVPLARR